MEATKIVFFLLTLILVATDAKPAGRGKDAHVSFSNSTFVSLLLIFSADLTLYDFGLRVLARKH